MNPIIVKKTGVTIVAIGFSCNISVIAAIEDSGFVSLSSVDRNFQRGITAGITAYRIDYAEIEWHTMLKLLAETREGWLKPQRKLKTQKHGGNGMINRLVNNRIREPGK